MHVEVAPKADAAAGTTASAGAGMVQHCSALLPSGQPSRRWEPSELSVGAGPVTLDCICIPAFRHQKRGGQLLVGSVSDDTSVTETACQQIVLPTGPSQGTCSCKSAAASAVVSPLAACRRQRCTGLQLRACSLQMLVQRAGLSSWGGSCVLPAGIRSKTSCCRLPT